MRYNEKIIITILLCVTILLSVILIITTIQKSIKNEAITECAQIATVTFSDPTGAHTTEPVQAQFDDCLKRKGY